jgi:hypothetical protein
MKEKLKVGDLCRILTKDGRYHKKGDLVLVLKVDTAMIPWWNVHTLIQRTGKKTQWTERSLEKINASI